MNFLSIPPTAIQATSISAQEGCASIADSAGNLLFYTNGREVWNKQHALMSNFLPGEQSSAQSALAFRKSGAQYYAFATGAWGTGNFGYGIIDMQQNAGLGAITNTVVLRTQVAERMAGTKHCNGKDTWVVIQPTGTNNFEAYIAGPNSVNTSPIISSIGPNVTTLQSYGALKFSPLGKKLAMTMVNNSNVSTDVILYSFNNQTGVISSPTVLASYSNDMCLSTEFSPDETKLYGCIVDILNTTGQKKIVQWDLCLSTASAIANSTDTVKIISVPGFTRDFQLAVDGKIYFTMAQFLGTISSPNLSGTTCAVSDPTISLNGLGSMGLPNFVSTSFRPKATFSHSVNCGTAVFSPAPLDPCVSAADPVLSRTWLFGDAASPTPTSSLINPQHTYSSNGNYLVKLVLNYTCHIDTIEQSVQINALPNLTLTGKTSICTGESSTYSVSGANTFTWSTSVNTPTVSLPPSSTSTFSVSGSNQNCSATKIFTVQVKACTALSEENEKEEQVVIYPNPGQGHFTLYSAYEAGFQLYHSGSMLLKSGRINKGEQVLDLQAYSAGIYFLRIQSTDGDRVIRLIVE